LRQQPGRKAMRPPSLPATARLVTGFRRANATTWVGVCALDFQADVTMGQRLFNMVVAVDKCMTKLFRKMAKLYEMRPIFFPEAERLHLRRRNTRVRSEGARSVNGTSTMSAPSWRDARRRPPLTTVATGSYPCQITISN
jgi:hypothetical protein